MLKKLSVLALTLLLALTLGLNNVQAEETEITFWHHEAPAHRVEAFQELIDRFEEEHPDISVNQEVIGWDEAFSATMSAIDAETVPDFQLDIPELNLVAQEAGGIVPVTELIEDLDDQYEFLDGVLAPYNYEDEYWGVPIWTMPHVLLYRPTHLQEFMGTTEPPATWEETLEYAEELTADSTGDGQPDVYGIGLTSSQTLLTQQQAWSVLSTHGTNVFDEEGNVTFNSEETIKGLETFQELYEYSPPGAAGWGWGEIEMNFAAGNIAMMPFFGGLQLRFFEAGDFDLAAAEMPVPAEDGRQTAYATPNAVHIFEQTKERGTYDAVLEFIEFMMQPEIVPIYTAGSEPGSFIPVTRDAADAPEYWENPVVQEFEDMHETLIEVADGKSNLYGYEHGELSNRVIGEVAGANMFAEVIQNLILEDYTPEEAAEWGENEIIRYMED